MGNKDSLPNEHICAACDLNSLQIGDAISNHGDRFIRIHFCTATDVPLRFMGAVHLKR